MSRLNFFRFQLPMHQHHQPCVDDLDCVIPRDLSHASWVLLGALRAVFLYNEVFTILPEYPN